MARTKQRQKQQEQEKEAPPVTDLDALPDVRDTSRLDLLDIDTGKPCGIWLDVAGRHSPQGTAAGFDAAQVVGERLGDRDGKTDQRYVQEWKREVALRVVVAWNVTQGGTALAPTPEHVAKLFAKKPDAWPQVYRRHETLADFFAPAATG